MPTDRRVDFFELPLRPTSLRALSSLCSLVRCACPKTTVDFQNPRRPPSSKSKYWMSESTAKRFPKRWNKKRFQKSSQHDPQNTPKTIPKRFPKRLRNVPKTFPKWIQKQFQNRAPYFLKIKVSLQRNSNSGNLFEQGTGRAREGEWICERGLIFKN